MIKELIENKYYKFAGTIQDLKNKIGSLKLHKIVDEHVGDVHVLILEGTFRYKSNHFYIRCEKDMIDDNIFYLKR